MVPRLSAVPTGREEIPVKAAIQGWLVVRATTEMVDDGRAISLIGRALWTRGGRR